MASAKSLEMRFSKDQLSSRLIVPSTQAISPEGLPFLWIMSQDGQLFASKSPGGPIVNVTKHEKRLRRAKDEA